jgi:peroxiredoxin
VIGVLAPSHLARSQRRVADRLVGLKIPCVVLRDHQKNDLQLGAYTAALPVVVYFYPGSATSPVEGDPVALMDALQHRAFRDHRADLEARGYRAIGISSESLSAQRLTTLRNRLPQQLLSDPKLDLAQQLQLPTFALAGKRWYQRLTLVVSARRIEKAFFPVPSPARNAAQVIAWMTMQGIG